ncbi:type II toxin-antitoxin system HipA family toxin [Novosphingobium aquimarinum]|uniref:Type II toxin-antitoxin system HipA family toxin n=2 Tax=Pelagerythrobacter aerophilus TaxID=2306995 RepID=A0A418NH30_9SPHN|nr:HipA domain-containing protein [Novosphingobium aquimarinum]MAK99704.1 phosphatidylinositol kinase [Citromicrobium sp.]RIV77607.1 type II toxin-antitoxin system HipA family toxin [Pelagerythrobacter aerophilus]HAD15866.1 phosphatidylinositol kinase [Erythrobacter sp.]
MTTIRTYVFVHLEEGPVPAGLLTMTDEPRNQFATFAYGRRYLERADRIPVDPVALPLHEAGTSRTFRTEEGFAVFGGIRDAAPDGWGQYLMYKAMGDRLPSEIDLILASGEHRVGALAFGPTPARPERITPWGGGPAPGEEFTLAELAEAAERAQHVDELDENLRALLAAGSSLGGARPKAATKIGEQPWIAKFQKRGDSFPECRVELATMRLASECGLDVPPLDFRCVLDRDIYLIERFDRIPHGNWLERRPFASGLTMLGAHESEVSSFSYADLAGAIRQFGTEVRQDLHELFRRMLLNILVTNDDDHLRNHGFLFDGEGWRLSPLYDVVPKPQLGLERRLVLGVGPEGRNATIENALAGAAVFDLGPDDAKAIAEDMSRIVATRWEHLFTEAGISAADRKRFATCFRLAAPAL